MTPQFNTIEHAWITKAGLAAVVIMTEMGHRCGYVAVLPDHSLHGVGYYDETYALKDQKGTVPTTPEMVFDVHGGITFSGVPTLLKKLDEYDLNPWWFGFDCAHAGDAASPEYYTSMRREFPDKPFLWEPALGYGVHRDLEFCITHCESLAVQIKTMTAPRWLMWVRRAWAAVTTMPG